MRYRQNGRYAMTVKKAQFEDDGSLCLSLRFEPEETPPLDKLLTNGYVKLSVYDGEDFAENGTLSLYGRSHC